MALRTVCFRDKWIVGLKTWTLLFLLNSFFLTNSFFEMFLFLFMRA